MELLLTFYECNRVAAVGAELIIIVHENELLFGLHLLNFSEFLEMPPLSGTGWRSSDFSGSGVYEGGYEGYEGGCSGMCRIHYYCA